MSAIITNSTGMGGTGDIVAAISINSDHPKLEGNQILYQASGCLSQLLKRTVRPSTTVANNLYVSYQ